MSTSRRRTVPLFHHSTSSSAAGSEQVTVLLNRAQAYRPRAAAYHPQRGGPADGAATGRNWKNASAAER